MAGTLMQWGVIQFEIFPLNFHEYDHVTGSDWAKKEVIESSPQREWVGEQDEEIHMRGRIFPHYQGIGGMPELDYFDQVRRQGQAHLLVRGGLTGGEPLGWFVCERLIRQHTFIAADGVGKVVQFDASFARVDVPYAPDYFASLTGVQAGAAASDAGNGTGG